jgi:hypothetical protein
MNTRYEDDEYTQDALACRGHIDDVARYLNFNRMELTENEINSLEEDVRLQTFRLRQMMEMENARLTGDNSYEVTNGIATR